MTGADDRADDRAGDRTAAGLAAPGFDAADALGALDVGVLCTDAGWCVTYANAAWGREAGGRAAASVVGRSFWDAFPALAAGEGAAGFRATHADGRPRAFRLPYHDGRAESVYDVTVRRTAAGGLVCTVHDATAQVHLERVHERLLEGIGEGLFVVDAQQRLTYVNAAAERITGITRAALLGRPLLGALPSLRGTMVEAMLRGTMTERSPRFARTVRLAREPGGPVAGVFDARSYPLDDGGLLVLFAEVGARERQARLLAEQGMENARLRELARTMAGESDRATLLEALCGAALRLCGAQGATIAELDGDGAAFVAAAGHPAGVRGHRFAVAGTLTGRLRDAHRAGRAPGVLRASDADSVGDAAFDPRLAGGRVVGEVLLAPLAAHGTLLGALAVSRAAGEPPFGARDEALLEVVADHASLALWKARLLVEADTARTTQAAFLATVSHELRTPLTALTGYGELLADEILGPLTGEQGDVVDRMRTVTHQLTGMIEEILTYSSLEAGRELVRPAPTDLAEVAAAVAAVVGPLAAQKGLAFAATVAPGLPPLVTDGAKLRQILLNMAGNAVKFTARGSVRLDVSAADGVVRCAVADTGIGIAAGDLGRLFQPFTQLDMGLTRRHGGTGLGLYIAQRLAQLLGGRIAVVSTPQVGSLFTLELPVAPPAERAAERPVPPVGDPR